jgi:hypothetical protein
MPQGGKKLPVTVNIRQGNLFCENLIVRYAACANISLLLLAIDKHCDETNVAQQNHTGGRDYIMAMFCPLAIARVCQAGSVALFNHRMKMRRRARYIKTQQYSAAFFHFGCAAKSSPCV